MTILESEHGRKAVEAALDPTLCEEGCKECAEERATVINALTAALPHLAAAFAEAVETENSRLEADENPPHTGTPASTSFAAWWAVASFLRTLR